MPEVTGGKWVIEVLFCCRSLYTFDYEQLLREVQESAEVDWGDHQGQQADQRRARCPQDHAPGRTRLLRQHPEGVVPQGLWRSTQGQKFIGDLSPVPRTRKREAEIHSSRVGAPGWALSQWSLSKIQRSKGYPALQSAAWGYCQRAHPCAKRREQGDINDSSREVGWVPSYHWKLRIASFKFDPCQ